MVNTLKTIALLYKPDAIDKPGLKAARDQLVSEKKGDRKAGEKGDRPKQAVLEIGAAHTPMKRPAASLGCCGRRLNSKSKASSDDGPSPSAPSARDEAAAVECQPAPLERETSMVDVAWKMELPPRRFLADNWV